MDALTKALEGGLREISGEKLAGNDDDDTAALYTEYKSAKNDKDALRALKQLIKHLK
jgi:hypothetical protein